MATTATYRFTANASRISIPGMTGSDGTMEYSNTTSHNDPIVRAVANEFAKNGLAAGTITVTVA